MDDPLRVRGIEGLGNLGSEIDHLRGGQRAPADEPGQHVPVEHLHRQEVPAFVLADFVDGADVRMVQAGDRAGFVLETRLAVQPAGCDELEHDLAAEGQVVGVVHLGATPFADLGDQLVVRDRLARHIGTIGFTREWRLHAGARYCARSVPVDQCGEREQPGAAGKLYWMVRPQRDTGSHRMSARSRQCASSAAGSSKISTAPRSSPSDQ